MRHIAFTTKNTMRKATAKLGFFVEAYTTPFSGAFLWYRQYVMVG